MIRFNTFLITLFLLQCTEVLTQDLESIIATYSQRVDASFPDSLDIPLNVREAFVNSMKNQKSTIELICNKFESKSTLVQNIQNQQASPKISFVSVESESERYSNFDKGYYIILESIPKRVYVKDTLIRPNWVITRKDSIINGYLARMATTTVFNRNVTAWYSKELPFSCGPKSYWGLPGIIVLIKESDITGNEKTYIQLNEIKPFRSNTTISPNLKRQHVLNREEYEKLIKEFLHKQRAYRTQGVDTSD